MPKPKPLFTQAQDSPLFSGTPQRASLKPFAPEETPQQARLLTAPIEKKRAQPLASLRQPEEPEGTFWERMKTEHGPQPSAPPPQPKHPITAKEKREELKTLKQQNATYTAKITDELRKTAEGETKAPFLRLRGKWLAKLGFSIGKTVKIAPVDGGLFISLEA
jgi:hypothetical protein